MAVRKVVEVEWLDAQSSLEPLYIKEIKEELKPIETKSVGYLIEDNQDFIVLGFTDFGSGLIKHHQVIPKPIIKKMKTIRDGIK